MSSPQAPAARRTASAIALASAVTVTAILPLFLTGALAVQLRRDLGFDQSRLGVALGIFLGVGSLCSTLSGRAADRFGPAPGMRYSALLAGASLLFIAVLADTWALLVVGLVAGGLANALGQPSANLFLSRAVPPARQGLAFGFRQSAAPTAALLGGIAVPVLALTAGWRWAYATAAAMAWATALFVPRLPRSRGTAAAAAARTATLRRGPLAVLAVASGFGFAAASALTGFLVDAAVLADFSESSAGLLLGLGSVIAIVVRVVLGTLADHRGGGHLRVATGMLAVGTLAFVLLALATKPLMVVGTVLGFATTWGWSGLFFFSVVRLNPEAPGEATGIAQTGAFFGGVAGPLVFGSVVELRGYGTGWLVAGAWTALAGAAMWAGQAWDRRIRGAQAVSALAGHRP